MNSILISAVIIVTCALVFYSVAVVTEQRKHSVSRRVLLFLTAGVCCDITSTMLMIAGSRNIPITIHGVLGYTALLAMIVDAAIIWKLWVNRGRDFTVDRPLHLYTRIAYIWWIIAYMAGSIISFMV